MARRATPTPHHQDSRRRETAEAPEGVLPRSVHFANADWRCCLAIVLHRVPPSAIAGNISDAIGALAPEDEAGNALPCERTILKMRGELTVASEAIAAFRVALAKRVISFGWDESTKFGLGLLSSNTQVGPAITSI